MKGHLHIISRHLKIHPSWMVNGISKGKGFKRPKFPKERGCSCEIIFPEGHAKLVIIDSDRKCTYAYYVVLANKN